MTHRRLLLLAAPALIADCSVLDRPYVETRRYPLEPRRAMPPRSGAGRRTLLVRTLRAGAGLEARGLRTIRPDGTESLDAWSEWAAPPAEGAEQAMRRWLLDSRLFAAILAPGSRVAPDFSLEGELTQIAAFQGQGVARAELTLLLADERNGSRLVGQMVSKGSATLASGTEAPSADQAAEAMVAALGNALSSLEQALARVT